MSNLRSRFIHVNRKILHCGWCCRPTHVTWATLAATTVLYIRMCPRGTAAAAGWTLSEAYRVYQIHKHSKLYFPLHENENMAVFTPTAVYMWGLLTSHNCITFFLQCPLVEKALSLLGEEATKRMICKFIIRACWFALSRGMHDVLHGLIHYMTAVSVFRVTPVLIYLNIVSPADKRTYTQIPV